MNAQPGVQGGAQAAQHGGSGGAAPRLGTVDSSVTSTAGGGAEEMLDAPSLLTETNTNNVRRRR